MNKFKDKIIVISGGSTGIGLSISKKIAHEKGTVVIISRNIDNLKKSINDINDIYKSDHCYFVGDVGLEDNVKSFSSYVKERFGNIDGLVNCAGIIGSIGRTTDVNMDEFIKAINVNLMGTIYMCREFINLFSGRKKIVNFSGGGATNLFPNYSSYSISKIGIVRFTENLSLELDNIDVNCVAPGFVSTDIHKKTLELGPDFVGMDYYMNTLDLLRSGGVSPDKSAELVSFLLSDESNGISGKLISAQWDDWKNSEFQKILKTDMDFATIRRIDNKNFFKK